MYNFTHPDSTRNDVFSAVFNAYYQQMFFPPMLIKLWKNGFAFRKSIYNLSGIFLDFLCQHINFELVRRIAFYFLLYGLD